MKGYLLEFVRRGLTACGFGPLVLAGIYLVQQKLGYDAYLQVGDVCTGIVTLTALAFVAGGIGVLYRLERLPLMAAILIHGAVLYGCYLATYLLNGWLEQGKGPLLVFTVIFVVGYLGIWAVICCVTRRSTARINEILKQRQQRTC